MQNLNIEFNDQDIIDICGSSSVKRAKDYVRRKKVKKITLDDSDNMLKINAIVSGTGNRKYHQEIELFPDIDDDLIIEGMCSCPVGYNCKHVAAVLIHLLGVAQQQSDHPPPAAPSQNTKSIAENWLSKFAQLNHDDADPGHAVEGNQYCLTYILRVRDQEDSSVGRLSVEVRKARILKSGNYGRTSEFELRSVFYQSAYAFCNDQDRELARILLTYEDRYDGGYDLHGEVGEFALLKLLATQRLHIASLDSPALSLSDTRPLSFAWEPTQEGQQLVGQLSPSAFAMFVIHDLWYFDEKMWRLGRVEHATLSGKQSMLFLEAPPIPLEQLADVAQRILSHFPEHNIPTPDNVEIERIDIKDVMPLPQLRLVQNSQLGSKQRMARLSFIYGEFKFHDVSAQKISEVRDGNTFYLIHRRPELEQAFCKRLSDFDLAPLQSPALKGGSWFGFPHASFGQLSQLWFAVADQIKSVLEQEGWLVEVDTSFDLVIEEVDEWDGVVEESDDSDWFSLSMGINVNNERLDLLPILVQLLKQNNSSKALQERLEQAPHVVVQRGESQWLKLPSERILPIFNALTELFDNEPLDNDEKLKVSRYQSMQLSALFSDQQTSWHGNRELELLQQQLRSFTEIQPQNAPEGFTATLREYQKQGLAWMQFLREYAFNGILADDMGLGKTVQTLAHLLTEKRAQRMDKPSLVISPTSLISNWRREAEQFAPELKVLTLHGPQRHERFELIDDHDVVLTTYPLVRFDEQQLNAHSFHYIILDEAQTIKNNKSKTTQIIYDLKSRHRLCLTGTPLENHLGELWSMYRFLMPGFLGSSERFNRLFRTPVEKHQDQPRLNQLQSRIKPFLLRRTKNEVVSELPPKTEIIRSVSLDDKQRDLYESIRVAMDKKLRQEIAKKGFKRSHIMILDALLKLRQACCDPRLLSLPQAKKVKESAKLELLMNLLPEMIAEGRKVLLFSQFTTMLALIEDELNKSSIRYSKLTGETRNRDKAISAFQEGDADVFLISLKAGGVGLNLTAADTVIHYDPWWNPAVEQQATDRAHRIGQDKPVFVYKLITEDTVEDKILTLQKKKQALADSIYAAQKSGEGTGALLSAEDLDELLKPL